METRKQLCLEYRKLIKVPEDYEEIGDDFQNETGMFCYDLDDYEVNDETLEHIKHYNELVRIKETFESKLDIAEEMILDEEIDTHKEKIIDYFTHDCKKYIQFDSPERMQKREEIKKKILKYLNDDSFMLSIQ